MGERDFWAGIGRAPVEHMSMPAHELSGPNSDAVELLLNAYVTLTPDEVDGLAREWRATHGTHHLKARGGMGRRRAMRRLRETARAKVWERAMQAASEAYRDTACDRLRDRIIMLMRLGAMNRDFHRGDTTLYADAGNAVQDAAVALLLQDVITVADFMVLYGPWRRAIESDVVTLDDESPSEAD